MTINKLLNNKLVCKHCNAKTKEKELGENEHGKPTLTITCKCGREVVVEVRDVPKTIAEREGLEVVKKGMSALKQLERMVDERKKLRARLAELDEKIKNHIDWVDWSVVKKRV